VGSLAQIVLDDGGSMVANDRMGRRRLGYPIRKFDDGVYTRFLYDSTAEVPKELDRRIRLSDKVLRHLTVRLEPDWAVAAKEQWAKDVEAARVAAIEAAAREKADAEAREKAEAAAKEKAEAEAEAAAAAAAAAPEVVEEESSEGDPALEVEPAGTEQGDDNPPANDETEAEPEGKA